ncbi:MAG: TnpV protein [Clostridia bacterium]|nr:TnpV protein [Clostridia bacterium]
MELTYTKCGDYYLPDFIAPKSPEVGRYGKLYLRYMKNEHRAIYNTLLYSGKLSAEAERIDREAYDMMRRLIESMAKAQGITEQLKADDQMAWVGRMNNIRATAEELVLQEVVYA